MTAVGRRGVASSLLIDAEPDGFFIDPAMAAHIEANLEWLAGRRDLWFVTAPEAMGGGRATGG